MTKLTDEQRVLAETIWSSDVAKQLDEAGLGSMVKNAAANVRDRAIAGAGQQFGLGMKAQGRLDVSAGAAKLMQAWNRYVGTKQKTGNSVIAHKPTVRDLVNFLNVTFQYEIPEDKLEDILGSNGTAPAQAPANDTAAPAPGLQNTTTEEFNRLLSLFPMLAEGLADTTTFDPRVVFPRLAEFMINSGNLTVNRKNPTASKGGTETGATGADGKPVDPNSTMSNEVFSGYMIDMNALSKSLVGADIGGNQMAELKGIVAQGPQGYQSIRKNRDAEKTLMAVVEALFISIQKGNTAKNISTQHANVTSSGNSINMATFKARLDKYGVKGDVFAKVRQDIHNAPDKLMNLLGTDNIEARMVFNIAHALTDSIVNANAQKAA